MSDYFACLDLINFKISSALLALSVVGCAAGAGCSAGASGCGAGAVSFTSAFTGSAVLSTATGLSAVGILT
jgi:hypothetical protein